MRTLPGQELAHTDYAELLKRADALLWEIVYKPVVDLVRPTLPAALRPDLAPRALRSATPEELRNAGDAEGKAALKRGLETGAVQLVADHTGRQALFAVVRPDRHVSDGLKSFGARLNKATDLWACAPAQVPGWAREAARGYAAQARAAHDAVRALTQDLAGRVDRLVDEANLAKGADHAIAEVAAGWKERALGLQVPPDLGPAGQAALVAGYERTRGLLVRSPGTKVGMAAVLELSTKKELKVWAHEALARLRAEVDLNAAQGYRAEGLARRVRDEYGVSKGRADLIARQETSNFMANYRQARAYDAGLHEYQWYCVRDSKTRKDHLALHVRVFPYAKPPVTDTRTGARNNPGQDFRCRCNDRPVVRPGRA